MERIWHEKKTNIEVLHKSGVEENIVDWNEEETN